MQGINLVTWCLSTEVLPLETAHKCSARARAYMLAYRARFLLSENPTEAEEEELRRNPICFDLLNKCVKTVRTHRNAYDYDRGFITMINKMREIGSGE